MPMNYKSLFSVPKPLIACVHLLPLPGSPGYKGSMNEIMDRALEETEVYRTNNVHGIIVENFRDVPFYPHQLPPETIASMTTVTCEVVKLFNGPVGVNALRNDASSALAIALASGGRFIRVNIHTGAAITDQGIIEGKAHETLRLRKNLNADILIFADVHVKHASPMGTRSLELEARDASERGLADALIVSGTGTGQTTHADDVERVKQNTHVPVLIGSGIVPGNLMGLYKLADGFIVGSYFKKDGLAENQVDTERVRLFSELFANM
jgi:uncharacterized protein